MRRLVICLVLSLGAAGSVRAEPPTTHEIIYTKPSGFWTSNRPVEGWAYRWRMLGIGGAVLLGMGFVMLRLVRKASAERSRPSPWDRNARLDRADG